MIPENHQKFVDQAMPKLVTLDSIVGVAAAGSWISQEMDEFSDVDLVLVVRDEDFTEVLPRRREIASSLGNLVEAFSGEHVGEPNLMVCLYEDPVLHVDLSFVSETNFRLRSVNPLVLSEKQGALTRIIESSAPRSPGVDMQWMEDRFWTWIHYGALKIGRGEFFETLNMVGYLRGTVLGPLLLHKCGAPARGVRRIEETCAEALPALRGTLCTTDDPDSCERALKNTAKLYLDLRESLASQQLVRNRRAEMAAMKFLHEACDKARSKNVVQFRHS